jgi:ubiquinone/menaquinone biosynthesis C-methylase UbiE
VGSGPGTITADLARIVAPGRVVAVDAAEGIVGQARELMEAQGLQNVVCEVGDVYSLGYPEGSFDVVHAHQVLQHLGDPVGALAAMRRVCREGGLVAARDSDYAAFTLYPKVPELAEWSELYHRLARTNGGEPDAGRRLLSWAQEAGFTEITPSASVWCFATPQDRAWWSELWAERLTASAIAEQAISHGFATRDDLERLSAGWRTWGAAPDGWCAVLHGEILCRA